MHIKQIQINNLRILKSLTLDLAPRFNLFYGDNASGKTSFLEAIYLLGMGRSFRSHRFLHILRHDETSLSVFAKLLQKQQEISLGIARSDQGELKIKANGEEVKSIAEIAKWLPIQLLEPRSHELLTDSSKLRRKYIDWGVFHVEHEFMPLWQRCQRLLKQRNAILKLGQGQAVSHWDHELADVSLKIDKMRSDYLQQLIPKIQEMLGILLAKPEIELQYWSGWPKDSDFAAVLNRNLRRDQQLRYTQYGPHRADIKVMVAGREAHTVLSQGQQKLIVYAMRLAQGLLLQQQLGKSSIFLLDDLAAELDANRRDILINLLKKMQAQVFITGVDQSAFDDLLNVDGTSLFEVKHGNISAV